jgi:uncharacterized membrane protein
MNIKNEIIIIVLILFTVLLLDGIMLFFLHSRWNDTITNIQGEPLTIRNKIFPVMAYILIVLGIRIFVYPYFVLGDKTIGIIMGFVWGVITYGIFDFTNLSLFKNYPIGLAIFDTIWGGILAALTGLITFYFAKKLKINIF